MLIHIEFDDGQCVTITPEELGEVVVDALTRKLRLLPDVPFMASPPARCPLCQFGRIGDGYCTCALGRDLKLVERPKATLTPAAASAEGDDLARGATSSQGEF